MNLTAAIPGMAFSPAHFTVSRPKALVIGFWSFTALLCLQIGFTAYAQMSLPQVSFSMAIVEPVTSVGGIVNAAPRPCARS